MDLDVKVAMEQFERRKAENPPSGHVNDNLLPAGSPMHYYCKHCGVQTEVLPESHVRAPVTCCEPCKVLRDHGLI